MYCKNCGKILQDDAIFCQFCGNRVVSDDQSKSKKDDQKSTSQIDSTLHKEDHTRNISRIDIIKIIGIIGVIIAIYFVGTHNNTQNLQNDDKNLTQKENIANEQNLQNNDKNLTQTANIPDNTIVKITKELGEDAKITNELSQTVIGKIQLIMRSVKSDYLYESVIYTVYLNDQPMYVRTGSAIDKIVFLFKGPFKTNNGDVIVLFEDWWTGGNMNGSEGYDICFITIKDGKVLNTSKHKGATYEDSYAIENQGDSVILSHKQDHATDYDDPHIERITFKNGKIKKEIIKVSNEKIKKAREKLNKENEEFEKRQENELAPKDFAIRYVDLQYKWGRDILGMSMIANFTITNRSQRDIKDITITCKHFGKSGTDIDDNTRTIYDIVPANSEKTFSNFNMGLIHSQTNTSNCEITDLKK